VLLIWHEDRRLLKEKEYFTNEDSEGPEVGNLFKGSPEKGKKQEASAEPSMMTGSGVVFLPQEKQGNM